MAVVVGKPWGTLGCWGVSVKTRYTNMWKTKTKQPVASWKLNGSLNKPNEGIIIIIIIIVLMGHN